MLKQYLNKLVICNKHKVLLLAFFKLTINKIMVLQQFFCNDFFNYSKDEKLYLLEIKSYDNIGKHCNLSLFTRVSLTPNQLVKTVILFLAGKLILRNSSRKVFRCPRSSCGLCLARRCSHRSVKESDLLMTFRRRKSMKLQRI